MTGVQRPMISYPRCLCPTAVPTIEQPATIITTFRFLSFPYARDLRVNLSHFDGNNVSSFRGDKRALSFSVTHA